ncbi:hypothetical protein NBRC116592_09410 [Colwellia sp. KU-HH00111]
MNEKPNKLESMSESLAENVDVRVQNLLGCLNSHTSHAKKNIFHENIQLLVEELLDSQSKLASINNVIEKTLLSREQFTVLFEKAPVGFIVLDEQYHIVEANTVARSQLNLAHDQQSPNYNHLKIVSFIVKGVADFIDWISADSTEGLIVELHDANKKGQVKLNQTSLIISKKRFHFISMISIAKEYYLNESLRLFKMVFEFSSQGIMIADVNKNIIEVNPAFSKITGYLLEDIKGCKPEVLAADSESEEYYQTIYADLVYNNSWKGIVYNCNKNGQVYPEELEMVAVYGADNTNMPIHYIGIFENISERVEKENKLKELAEMDILTGLYNRQGFNQKFENKFQVAQRNGDNFSILFIDLDNFKYLNDRYGHNYGDELLKLMALRITNNLKKTDVVARLGGDEFIIILSGNVLKASLNNLAHKLSVLLSKPYNIFDIEYVCSASIGIATYPDDAIEPIALLKSADAAMYQAKFLGRNRYQFFNEELFNQHTICQKTITDVDDGIPQHQFLLHYQAQHDMNTGDLVGFEALVRWHYSEGEIRYPKEFLPYIEKEQQMIKLGRLLINQAFINVNTWCKSGFKWPVSINLSADQLRLAETYELISTLCDKYPKVRSLIHIEVTETAIFENDPLIEKNINQLKQLGLHLVLDDFGTGYSSIYSLKKFQFDVIKIDKGFVDDILSGDNNNLVILNGIIRLIQELNIAIICEGVETHQQVDYLVNKDCKIAQGFFYHKPMHKNQMLKYIAPYL